MIDLFCNNLFFVYVLLFIFLFFIFLFFIFYVLETNWKTSLLFANYLQITFYFEFYFWNVLKLKCVLIFFDKVKCQISVQTSKNFLFFLILFLCVRVSLVNDMFLCFLCFFIFFMFYKIFMIIIYFCMFYFIKWYVFWCKVYNYYVSYIFTLQFY